jgi:hypothetical protein
VVTHQYASNIGRSLSVAYKITKNGCQSTPMLRAVGIERQRSLLQVAPRQLIRNILFRSLEAWLQAREPR